MAADFGVPALEIADHLLLFRRQFEGVGGRTALFLGGDDGRAINERGGRRSGGGRLARRRRSTPAA